MVDSASRAEESTPTGGEPDHPDEPAGTRPPAGPGVRERARAAVLADLLATARQHLDRDGAAGLSLRSIARDLGMVSSAVYRYVDSRDALLTLLIVAGYDEVGQAVEAAAARARRSGAHPAETWLVVARSFREWALAHRATFELLYGTPVRGYAAPQDTVPRAARLWMTIAGILAEALERGELLPSAAPVDVTGLLAAEIYAYAGFDDPADAPRETQSAVVRSGSLFAALIGAVSAELFGHLAGFSDDPARYFDVTIQTASAGIGLRIEL